VCVCVCVCVCVRTSVGLQFDPAALLAHVIGDSAAVEPRQALRVVPDHQVSRRTV